MAIYDWRDGTLPRGEAIDGDGKPLSPHTCRVDTLTGETWVFTTPRRYDPDTDELVYDVVWVPPPVRIWLYL